MINADEFKSRAKAYFNETWDLMDLKERTGEQKAQMLDKAHASNALWAYSGGSAVNAARGTWQISRVYSILGWGEPALFYAELSLKHCADGGIGDFDLAFGYEAVGRAHSVLKNAEKAEEYKKLGLAACAEIAEKEDREYAAGQFDF